MKLKVDICFLSLASLDCLVPVYTIIEEIHNQLELLQVLQVQPRNIILHFSSKSTTSFVFFSVAIVVASSIQGITGK